MTQHQVTVRSERFPALTELPGIRHLFIGRVHGIDVRADREEALSHLGFLHTSIRESAGFPRDPFATAKQVHGNHVAVLREAVTQEAPETDGLITNVPGLCLGVYVADCCAIYLADPVKRVIGLLHSGKKGTELRIAQEAVKTMVAEYGSNPADIVAQLSPCIRPPLYEIDFAADIARQLKDIGVIKIADCGKNTGADLDSYYSYRMEKGRTGRLLALLMIDPEP